MLSYPADFIVEMSLWSAVAVGAVFGPVLIFNALGAMPSAKDHSAPLTTELAQGTCVGTAPRIEPEQGDKFRVILPPGCTFAPK